MQIIFCCFPIISINKFRFIEHSSFLLYCCYCYFLKVIIHFIALIRYAIMLQYREWWYTIWYDNAVIQIQDLQMKGIKISCLFCPLQSHGLQTLLLRDSPQAGRQRLGSRGSRGEFESAQYKLRDSEMTLNVLQTTRCFPIQLLLIPSKHAQSPILHYPLSAAPKQLPLSTLISAIIAVLSVHGLFWWLRIEAKETEWSYLLSLTAFIKVHSVSLREPKTS